MRKLLMLMVAALALTGWSFAQDQNNQGNDQDKDKAAKQDMKKAGHDTKDAAKATGRGVKNGATWTKDKVTGDDKDKDRRPESDRDADRDRSADRDRNADQDRSADKDRDSDAARNRNADNDRDRDRDRDADQGRNRNTAYSGNASNAGGIHITNGPNINPSSNSANINWNTNGNAATDVWLMGPGINGHRVEYDRGGSNNHSVSFDNLRPHTTYTYEIRTNNGGDRKQGTFTTR